MPETALLSITDRALERLRSVADEQTVDLAAQWLRVAVTPGGCSGLTYDLGWDSALQPGDETLVAGGIRVAMDPRSLVAVEGTTLDFTDGLEGRGFHFDNPLAARTCACGESFSL